jgi:hypothetical protein
MSAANIGSARIRRLIEGPVSRMNRLGLDLGADRRKRRGVKRRPFAGRLDLRNRLCADRPTISGLCILGHA